MVYPYAKQVVIFPKKTFKEVVEATKEASWVLVLPVLIIVGIRMGVVTLTEAAVVAVFYTLFLCLVVYRTVKLRELPKIWWRLQKQPV